MPIGKPRFDTRPGITASATTRLWICALICMSQYWLLTASVDAFHSGNHHVVFPAFLGSVACFALVAGLILTGEAGARRMHEDLRDE